MESSDAAIETQRPQNHEAIEEKPKVVVIMGPTGSGKSKLAIDLASHFPVEVINADSMQVYSGLDVLSNKVPLHEQKGVAHHLLGTVSPNVEFTAKEFRDSAILLINDILSRNCLPVIVGGTNYYIQALVSPFLLDETVEDIDECCLGDYPGDGQPQAELVIEVDNSGYGYDYLKAIDPVAANRVHPNNHRKISQYLSLYAHHGVLPSQLLQGNAAKNWGRVDNFRYNCCFICVNASLPVLDQYVDQRVDCMIDAGLLNEVYEIFNPNADYTRGLRQAIGVREFENFLRAYIVEASDEGNHLIDESMSLKLVDLADKKLMENMREILKSFSDSQPKIVLKEAIDKMKMNTRRLVRRQKRRINRLETLFGWNIHFLDATESISCKADNTWATEVVGPAVEMIRSFLNQDSSLVPDSDTRYTIGVNTMQRDLWTQYTCKACGDKILRGAHEWEQHRQGRVHRKRVSQLKKSQGFLSPEQHQLPQHVDCS
ncbi:LOW QUALITY PROTEIN: tRNA dimethylallyltransferase 2 [Pyrus x bretschneideri]|uniref:LOW QUALITY PROTEIN: tRNA dimethylallyltransferase 2 n=1 Tax=Pyrus x bretschneideri TaxID=225117 RepID=UPI0020305E3D|nr:LOW QUALITY PROTEIN: tRNA dimethylallyltransferase 2 [Pyrus x bretschneideri]